jgi:hypothetical protein
VSLLYEGNGTGRTYWQAPDVDGKVILEDAQNMSAGRFYDVLISGCEGYDLAGQVL